MKFKKYQPPKVKPSAKKKNEVLPQWDSNITDMSRYKLAPTEMLKKRINSVSKNLDTAKRMSLTNVLNTTLEENYSEENIKENSTNSQNSGISAGGHKHMHKSKHKRSRSTVSQSLLNTVLSEGNLDKKPWDVSSVSTKRNTSSSNIIRDYQENTISKIKLKKYNSNEKLKKGKFIITSVNSKRNTTKDFITRRANEDYENLFEDEINLIESPMVKIKITKVDRTKQNDLLRRNSARLRTIKEECQNYETNGKILDISYEKKLRELEEKLNRTEGNFSQNIVVKDDDNKAKVKDKKSNMQNNLAHANINKKILFTNSIEEKENFNKTESQNFNVDGCSKQNEYQINRNEKYLNVEDELIEKFDNLSGIEESMKQLNDILDLSSKSSMKFKYEQNNLINPEFLSHKDEKKEKENYENENINSLKVIDQPIRGSAQNQNLNHKQNKFSNNKNFPKNSNDIENIPASNIPNYNSVALNKSSNKKVSIDRNIVNLDNGENYFSENRMKENEKNSKSSHKDIHDLDYMKDLLMKTKKDLDTLNNKFNTNLPSNYFNDKFENEDESIPLKPPTFISNNYNKQKF